ncbi:MULTISPECIES: S8 family serine peptidase [unclassified Nonomuraea]|uniref:S8 family serine peptidase n=1 Tax=unclassified Nonomuraea TaxID=2593643 RepID=UPI0033E6D0C7
MMGRVLLASLLALQAAVAPVVLAAPAGAVTAPEECDPDKGTLKLPAEEPWAQRRLDIKNAWRLTRGAGVTVAIVDSGADYTHPQLRVSKFLDVTHTGYRDCVGHGTAIAGIVGGRYVAGVPFHGVAPEAQIISVKQSNKKEGDVRDLAAGITLAVKYKVDVINVSVKASDHPALRAAIQDALAHDVVVVAAAGNIDKDDGASEPAYPAAYDGVLSVGSATQDGRRADSSSTATPVSVLGPGVGITATWPGKAYALNLEGTSFAAPYVAGVAALVRSRFPKLDQQQVRHRIIATADGTLGAATGAGMVNPTLAVTAVLPFQSADAPVVASPAAPPLPAGAITKAAPPDHKSINVAWGVMGGALSLAGIAAAGTWVLPLGRRRRWRPGRPS